MVPECEQQPGYAVAPVNGLSNEPAERIDAAERLAKRETRRGDLCETFGRHN
jgi:hypothetical protein